MKSKKQPDIWMLLGSLVAFSCLVGFLIRDPQVQAQDEGSEDVTESFSPGEIIDRLTPLIDSGSMQAVARSLYPVDFTTKKKVLNILLDPQSTRLDATSKRELIFDLARHVAPTERSELFSLLLPLADNEATLYTAVKTGYKDVVPNLLQWINTNQANTKDWPYAALAHAVDMQRLDLFKVLLAQGVPLNKEEAQQLLWRVLDKKSKAVFLPLLLEHGATVHTIRQGRTPLIFAVEQNDEELVSMLLQLQANINAMADPVVGTALQRAIELHHTAIELLLRERGARE